MFEKHNIHEGEFDTLEDAHDDAYGKTLPELYESGDLKVCTCSECKKELIAFAYCIQRAAENKLGILPEGFPEVVAGRIMGRPLCFRCLRS